MGSARSGSTRLSPPAGAGALRRQRLQWARLYFVCEARPGGRSPEDLLRAALANGAGMIELRDHGLPKDMLARAGESFARMAAIHSGLFIVNDDPHLALSVGADGVHIGQDDLSPTEAREIVGPDAIVGLSTHSREQIEAANEAPVDYISVGPIWETPTKPGRRATGLELITIASRTAEHPWFAIGGIDESNIADVLAAGATRVCVVRAIRDSRDPALAASALNAALNERASAGKGAGR